MCPLGAHTEVPTCARRPLHSHLYAHKADSQLWWPRPSPVPPWMWPCPSSHSPDQEWGHLSRRADKFFPGKQGESTPRLLRATFTLNLGVFGGVFFRLGREAGGTASLPNAPGPAFCTLGPQPPGLGQRRFLHVRHVRNEPGVGHGGRGLRTGTRPLSGVMECSRTRQGCLAARLCDCTEIHGMTRS